MRVMSLIPTFNPLPRIASELPISSMYIIFTFPLLPVVLFSFPKLLVRLCMCAVYAMNPPALPSCDSKIRSALLCSSQYDLEYAISISFPARIVVVACMLPVPAENFALFTFPCSPAFIFCAPFTAVRPSM